MSVAGVCVAVWLWLVCVCGCGWCVCGCVAVAGLCVCVAVAGLCVWLCGCGWCVWLVCVCVWLVCGWRVCGCVWLVCVAVAGLCGCVAGVPLPAFASVNPPLSTEPADQPSQRLPCTQGTVLGRTTNEFSCERRVMLCDVTEPRRPNEFDKWCCLWYNNHKMWT